MKIKIEKRVFDKQENKFIEPGTTIEREPKRGKDFLKYGQEIKEEKPKRKKRAKKSE